MTTQTSKTFFDTFDFTRNSSATYVGTDSRIHVMDAGLPRYELLADGGRSGIVLERGATNLIPNNSDLTTWATNNQLDVTPIYDPELFKVTNARAYRFTRTSDDSYAGAHHAGCNSEAGKIYCFSIYINTDDSTAEEVQLTFQRFNSRGWQNGAININTGAQRGGSGPYWHEGGTEDVGFGWKRVWAYCEADKDESNAAVQIRIAGTDMTGSVLVVAYPQLEEVESIESLPSSLIITNGVPTTREQDTIKYLLNDPTIKMEAGTWLFTGDMTNANLSQGIGVDDARFTGSGTIAYAFDSEGGEVFINGQSAQVTPPVVGTNITQVIFGGGDKLILSTITYIDGVKDIEGVSENTTGNFQFSTTFVNGNSLVMDIENERFGKRSLLDASVFNDGSVHDVIEVNRASYGGSYDENGQYVLVGENEPRYGLNPDGSRYLLIEPERTNIFAPNSDDLISSMGAQRLSKTSTDIISPAGTNAVQLTVDEESTYSYGAYSYAGALRDVTKGDLLTFSIFVRSPNSEPCVLRFWSGSVRAFRSEHVQVMFHLDDGEYSIISGAPVITGAGITGLTDGWYRIWMSARAEGTGNPSPSFNASTAIGVEYLIAAPQLEVGSSPTSPITTNSATPVTRLADEVTTTLGYEFKETQGTWVFRGKVENGLLARNLGHAGLRLTGEGTVVFTFTEEGGSVFFNGGKIFDIAPYSVSPSIVNFGMDDDTIQQMELVTYRSAVISHEDAVEMTEVGEFEYEYLFKDDVTFVADVVNGHYGVLDVVDPLETIEATEFTSVVDFTRASGATSGIAGVVVGNNEPKLNADGWVSIETTATNLYPYSDGTGSSASVAGWKGNATRSQDTLLGEPATKVVFDAGTSYVYGAQEHMTALYTDYVGRSTRSMRVKIEDGFYFGIRVAGMTATSYFPEDGRYHAVFDLDDGTLVYAGTLVNDNEYSITKVSEGIFDVSFTSPFFGDNPHYNGIAVGLIPKDGDASEWVHTIDTPTTMYITRTQVEAADHSSSYIPTSGTSVTRVADVVSKSIEDFHYNTEEGTWVVTANFIESVGCNLKGIGVDVVQFSGKGTVVITYNRDGVRVFSNEGRAMTLPPITTPTELIITGTVDIGSVQYRSTALDDADASELAVGDVVTSSPVDGDVVLDYNFNESDFSAKSSVDSLDSFRSSETEYLDVSRTSIGVNLIDGVDGYMRGEMVQPNNPQMVFGRLAVNDADENWVSSDFSEWWYTSDAFTKSTINPLYTGGPNGIRIINSDDSPYASYIYPIDDFDHEYISMAMVVSRGSADTFKFGLRDNTFSEWVFAVDFSWLDNKVRLASSTTGYNVSYGVRQLPSHPVDRGAETFFVWVSGKPKYRDHTGRFYFYPNGAGASMEGKSTYVHHAQMSPTRYPRLALPAVVGTGMEGHTSLNLPDNILSENFGTIAIEGYGDACKFVKNLGFDGTILSGEGTFAYRWNSSGGEFFANGAKLFNTAPPASFNGEIEFAVGEIGRVRFFDKFLSSTETKALTDGTFDVDYLFMGGEVFVADFSAGDFGRRDTTDGVNSHRTDAVGEYIDISRTTSGASNTSDDVMALVSQGQLRYGYTDTGDKGVLVEGDSTNLVVGTNTAPIATSGVDVTEEGTGPMVGTVAHRLTLNKSGANENGYWAIPNDLLDEDYTISVWVKFDTATTVNLRLWRGPYTVCDGIFTGNAGEWKLCRVTSTNNQAGGAVFLRAYPGPRISQTAGESLIVAMPQMENSTVGTSFIPTTDAVASRDRDVVTIDGSFVDPQKGTFVIEFGEMTPSTDDQYLFDLSPWGNGGCGLRLTKSGIFRFFCYDYDSDVIGLNGDWTGSERKIVISYKAGSLVMAMDGEVVRTSSAIDGGFAMPSSDNTIAIGSRVEGNMMANTVISKFKYYDTFHDVDTIINL
ncbi:MAG: hypothetical protein CMF22_11450 [Idiomarinaceae bacterium]|nr:hypothetical protein [Idiomarinaceae bacterium]|tara:strand:- start:89803 stop:95508 length:5706 start_codon:yes stop_codon:yes gene_type:complete